MVALDTTAALRATADVVEYLGNEELIHVRGGGRDLVAGQFGRRGESTALWVVPREAIRELEDFPDELGRNYHRVDGYSLKVKLKEARERAGAAPSDR